MREIKNGDFFFSEVGTRFKNGKAYKRFDIFEYKEGYEYGLGFRYTRGGRAISYYWAKPEESELISYMPKNVLFSFQHGSHSFHVNEEMISNCNSFKELIEASDFKFTTRQEIDLAKLTESITTMQGIRENWDHIKKHGATCKIAELCFQKIEGDLPPVKNGEIGIYCLTLLNIFHNNIDDIELALNLED